MLIYVNLLSSDCFKVQGHLVPRLFCLQQPSYVHLFSICFRFGGVCARDVWLFECIPGEGNRAVFTFGTYILTLPSKNGESRVVS